jgi:flagellum-specific peptidoglycan hydrolase FlgJ
MAASESNYGNAAGNELFGVKALPGQPGTVMQTHEGPGGGVQTQAKFAAYATPLDSVNAWIDLIKNHYPGAVNAPDLASFVHGLKAGGYFTAGEGEYLGIVQGIVNRIGGTVSSTLAQAASAVTPAPQSDTPGANVSSATVMSEADFEQANGMPVNYSTCGPTAAAALAASQGINLSPTQALGFAQGLWNSAVGMLGAGASGEVELLKRMGVQAVATGGVDWNQIQSEIAAGRPVILNLSGHGGHFAFLDGYNPDTGQYHGGASTGADLKGGSDWITPQRLQQLGFQPADTVVLAPQGGAGAGQDNPIQGIVQGAQGALSGLKQGAEAALNPLTQATSQLDPLKRQYPVLGPGGLGVWDPRIGPPPEDAAKPDFSDAGGDVSLTGVHPEDPGTYPGGQGGYTSPPSPAASKYPDAASLVVPQAQGDLFAYAGDPNDAVVAQFKDANGDDINVVKNWNQAEGAYQYLYVNPDGFVEWKQFDNGTGAPSDGDAEDAYKNAISMGQTWGSNAYPAAPNPANTPASNFTYGTTSAAPPSGLPPTGTDPMAGVTGYAPESSKPRYGYKGLIYTPTPSGPLGPAPAPTGITPSVPGGAPGWTPLPGVSDSDVASTLWDYVQGNITADDVRNRLGTASIQDIQQYAIQRSQAGDQTLRTSMPLLVTHQFKGMDIDAPWVTDFRTRAKAGTDGLKKTSPYPTRVRWKLEGVPQGSDRGVGEVHTAGIYTDTDPNTASDRFSGTERLYGQAWQIDPSKVTQDRILNLKDDPNAQAVMQQVHDEADQEYARTGGDYGDILYDKLRARGYLVVYNGGIGPEVGETVWLVSNMNEVGSPVAEGNGIDMVNYLGKGTAWGPGLAGGLVVGWYAKSQDDQNQPQPAGAGQDDETPWWENIVQGGEGAIQTAQQTVQGAINKLTGGQPAAVAANQAVQNVAQQAGPAAQTLRQTAQSAVTPAIQQAQGKPVTPQPPVNPEQLPVVGGIAQGARNLGTAVHQGLTAPPPPAEPTPQPQAAPQHPSTEIGQQSQFPLMGPAAEHQAQHPTDPRTPEEMHQAQMEDLKTLGFAGSLLIPGAAEALGVSGVAGSALIGGLSTAAVQAPDIISAIQSGDPSKVAEQAVNVGIGAAVGPAISGVSSAVRAGARALPFAPVGDTARLASAVLTKLREPGEVAASAAYQRATRGLTQGLDQSVLKAVPGVLDNRIPNARVAQMFRDAAPLTRNKGKFTAATSRLQREAQRLERIGTTEANMSGRQVSDLLHNIAPNAADQVLANHGFQSLTQPYRTGYQASRGMMPAAIPQLARFGTNAALGAAGGATAAVVNTSPNDPNYYQKVANGAATGAALMLGNAYLGGWISRDVLPATLAAWHSFGNPMRNLNAGSTTSKLQAWLSDQAELSMVDRANILDSLQRTWGDPSKYQEIATTLEKTGSLPTWLQGNKEAVQTWQLLKDTWDQAVKAGVADDVLKKKPTLRVLPNGQASYPAQFAIHHVPQADWLKAVAAANHGVTPKAMQEAVAGIPQVIKGQVSHFNTLSQIFKERTYANFEEGMAQGVKYDFSNLPRLLTDQYWSQKQAMANQKFGSALRGLIVNSNKLPAGTSILDHDLIQVPKNVATIAGTPPEGMTGFQLAGPLGFGSLLGPAGHNFDLYVSDPLAHTLNAAFKESGLFENNPHMRAIVRKALEMNTQGKEFVLGGSGFHLWNEINTFLASNGVSSLPRLAKIMGMAFTPGAFNKFVAANEADIRQAVRQGMTWNILPEIRPMTLTRGLTFGASTFGAGAAAYAGAKATGKNDEDARKYAAVASVLAAGINAPVGYFKTGEWTSLSTMFSDTLFTRIIPMMKLMTYQMNGKSAAAAQWVNESFGGENLAMMLRSRDISDLMRLTILAPDWTGSFVRQIGGALLDHGSKGSLNRGFWASAALNSVVMVEGLNMLLAGHPSWQNPPGQEGTVDLTPFFDRMGWKHDSPSSGEPAGVYVDVVPAWRGLIEPWKESARWGLAAFAGTPQGQQMGLGNPAITGGLRPGDPGRPDPAAAWGSYLQARGGIFPSLAADFLSVNDFAGRPLNKADDQWWQIAGNGILRAASRLAPAGVTAGMTSLERGTPGPVAAAQTLSGLRTRSVTDYAQAQTKREYEIEHGPASAPWTGKSLADQQQAHAEYVAHNAAIADQREAIKADPSLTPAQKSTQMAKLQFETLGQFEESLIPPEIQDGQHPDVIKQFKADMVALDAIRGNASGQQQADYISSPGSGLDQSALFNEAWNRDASQLAQARTDADKSALRRQWLTQTADNHGIDHDVLEDFVKARLFGEDLDPLPGMSSANLNVVRDAYEAAAAKSPNDITTARAAEQQVIGQYAQAFGVDAGALERRVYLRTTAPREQTAIDQQYNRAVTVLENTHNITTAPKYMNADGSPMNGPDQWAQYDTQLAATDKFDKYKGMYINKDLEAKALAKARGTAAAAQQAFKSPGYWDYERWFGTGRTMTDAQWQQYMAGTLPMWADNPSPQEAQNRNTLIGLYKALNTPDPKNPHRTLAMNTSVKVTFYNRTSRVLTLASAIQQFNKLKSNAWKATPDQTNNPGAGLGLDQNITNADAPPGADLSQVGVDTSGNTP